jgi:hypothetical protein
MKTASLFRTYNQKGESVMNTVIWITELDSQATDYLSEVILEELQDRGVNPTGISFRIEVEYEEEA